MYIIFKMNVFMHYAIDYRISFNNSPGELSFYPPEKGFELLEGELVEGELNFQLFFSSTNIQNFNFIFNFCINSTKQFLIDDQTFGIN